jgi:hypothetical protein
MPQRTVQEAEKAIAEAQEQVIKDGGVIHEDAGWDVAEMALDGSSKESMVERLKQERARPYVSRGRWRER